MFLTERNYTNYRTIDDTEETSGTELKVSSEQPIKSLELVNHLPDYPEQEKQKEGKSWDIFFRLWFGLNRNELVKTAIGSFAAAFSGISKPIFGFFIITIGVAYYKPDSKEKVGKYSLIFSSIGLLSLISHTLQHYFFGIIGEKAMRNLRQALYSGNVLNNYFIVYFLHTLVFIKILYFNHMAIYNYSCAKE